MNKKLKLVLFSLKQYKKPIFWLSEQDTYFIKMKDKNYD